MSRQFDGANDRIVTTIAAGLASYTYGTWAILLKMSAASDGAWAGLMNLHTSALTTARAGLEKGDTGNDNRINLSHGASSRKNPDAITSSDGWLLFVVGKGTGTVTPTWSLRTAGSSGTWSHGSMDGTLANGASSDSARMVFGEWEGTDDWAGFIAAAAIWDEVDLSNANREALWPGSSAGEMADWVSHASPPTHAWQFNQASTATPVEDLMNNGGDETSITGTSVSADEPADWTYFSAGITVTIGQATEVDTATAFARSKVKAFGQASEVDTATAMGRVKTRSIGLATEVDTATAFARSKTLTFGLASEVDTATAFGRLKTRTLGQAVEVDTAMSITPAGDIVVQIGQAVEVDTATTFGRAKTLGVGLATEVDTATAFTRAKALAVGQAREVNTASAMTVVGAIQPTGAGPRITTSTPAGRVVASTPPRYTTSTGGRQ